MAHVVLILKKVVKTILGALGLGMQLLPRMKYIKLLAEYGIWRSTI